MDRDGDPVRPVVQLVRELVEDLLGLEEREQRVDVLPCRREIVRRRLVEVPAQIRGANLLLPALGAALELGR
jgi:hypothetical protein